MRYSGSWILGALAVMAAMWGSMALDALGIIDSTTAALVTFLAVGYALGWAHSLMVTMRHERQQAVAMLSAVVSDMGSVLAGDELDEDERAYVQDQRASVLQLLHLMDRPSLPDRVLYRLGRR